MITLGIDPDMTTTGYAFIGAKGKLVKAGAIPPMLLLGHLKLAREPFRVTIECPQTYGGRAAKGDANDLITLARLVGRFEQAALTNKQCSGVRVVVPSEWKGQVPKAIMCLRAWDALDKDEQARVEIATVARNKLNRGHGLGSGQASDALDAVGIAQWTMREFPNEKPQSIGTLTK